MQGGNVQEGNARGSNVQRESAVQACTAALTAVVVCAGQEHRGGGVAHVLQGDLEGEAAVLARRPAQRPAGSVLVPEGEAGGGVCVRLIGAACGLQQITT